MGFKSPRRSRKAKKMKGFVYIAVNSSLPDQVKIGYSDRHPDQRMQELSNTSIPTPFHCAYTAMVDEPQKLEQAIHQRLGEVRVSPAREFFTLDVSSTIEELKKTANDFQLEIYYEEVEESLVNTHRREAEFPDESAIQLEPAEAKQIKSRLTYAIKNFLPKFRRVRQLAEELGNWELVEHLRQRQGEFEAWGNSYVESCDLSRISKRLKSADHAKNFERDLEEFVEEEARREMRWLSRLSGLSARFDKSLD